MIRADVVGDSIVELSIYCTGDWDEATAARARRGRPAHATLSRRRRPRGNLDEAWRSSRRPRRSPRPGRRRARGRPGRRRGAPLRRGGRPLPGRRRPRRVDRARCSARRRSTCSAPSRASCPPSSTTCWSAPPTTSRPGPAGGRARPLLGVRRPRRAGGAVRRRGGGPRRARRRPGADRRLPRRRTGRALGPRRPRRRRALAARLDEVAAHVLDPDARLQAHLWGLQVACESLDVQAIHRQMRALERLGEESPRALFFAASRRLMLDLLRGRTDTTARLIDDRRSGRRAGRPRRRLDGAQGDGRLLRGPVRRPVDVRRRRRRVRGVRAGRGRDRRLRRGRLPLDRAPGELDRARALVHTFHGRSSTTCLAT